MIERTGRRRSMSSIVETVTPGQRWRIRGSGVQGQPRNAALTCQILDGLSAAGIEVSEKCTGKTGDADAYEVSARFEDGGVLGMTGSHQAAPRGLFVDGPRALVVVAALLGRSIPSALLADLRATDAGIDAFIASHWDKQTGQLLYAPQDIYPPLPSTQIPRELLQAYLATLYEAHIGEAAPLMLRIGEHSPRLLAAHRKAKVDASVFITAFNPEGQPLSAEENEVRQQDLLNVLRDHVSIIFEGRGHSSTNDWEERSVLALGVPLRMARQLGTRFGQNAIVWSGADAVPRLILLR